jgi:hypothetical protein
MNYGAKNLIEAANNGSVEAQLLTSALVMLHDQPKYRSLEPDELLRELVRFHLFLISDQIERPK